MPALSVVATPIGNLQDITLRALEVLRAADVIACEDTRVTAKLLASFDIRKRLLSCRAANEQRAAAELCELLADGKQVAYVTDAGTPGLSDPGAALVRAARDAGFSVVPIPGPSALAALVSVAGMPTKGLAFEGFLSPKPGRRRARLRELLEREEAFVLYESPFRIVKLLRDLADLSPERRVLIGREMTKLHEEYLEASAVEVLRELENRERVLGEFTVLVSGRKMA